MVLAGRLEAAPKISLLASKIGKNSLLYTLFLRVKVPKSRVTFSGTKVPSGHIKLPRGAKCPPKNGKSKNSS